MTPEQPQKLSLSESDERAFRDWYKGYASSNGLHANPDDPSVTVDARALFQSRKGPTDTLPTQAPVRTPALVSSKPTTTPTSQVVSFNPYTNTISNESADLLPQQAAKGNATDTRQFAPASSGSQFALVDSSVPFRNLSAEQERANKQATEDQAAKEAETIRREEQAKQPNAFLRDTSHPFWSYRNPMTAMNYRNQLVAETEPSRTKAIQDALVQSGTQVATPDPNKPKPALSYSDQITVEPELPKREKESQDAWSAVFGIKPSLKTWGPSRQETKTRYVLPGDVQKLDGPQEAEYLAWAKAQGIDTDGALDPNSQYRAYWLNNVKAPAAGLGELVSEWFRPDVVTESLGGMLPVNRRLPLPFIRGLASAYAYSRANDALRRVQSGQGTEADLLVLRGELDEKIRQERPKTWLYRIADITSSSLVYAAELAATRRILPGPSAAAGSAVNSALLKAGLSQSGRLASGVRGAAQAVASELVRTPLTTAPYVGAFERMAPSREVLRDTVDAALQHGVDSEEAQAKAKEWMDPSFVTALSHSYPDAVIQNLGERLGFLFTPLKSAAGKAVGSVADKAMELAPGLARLNGVKAQLIQYWMSSHPGSTVSDLLERVAKGAQWHGWFEEIGEEFATDYMRAIVPWVQYPWEVNASIVRLLTGEQGDPDNPVEDPRMQAFGEVVSSVADMAPAFAVMPVGAAVARGVSSIGTPLPTAEDKRNELDIIKSRQRYNYAYMEGLKRVAEDPNSGLSFWQRAESVKFQDAFTSAYEHGFERIEDLGFDSAAVRHAIESEIDQMDPKQQERVSKFGAVSGGTNWEDAPSGDGRRVRLVVNDNGQVALESLHPDGAPQVFVVDASGAIKKDTEADELWVPYQGGADILGQNLMLAYARLPQEDPKRQIIAGQLKAQVEFDNKARENSASTSSGVGWAGQYPSGASWSIGSLEGQTPVLSVSGTGGAATSFLTVDATGAVVPWTPEVETWKPKGAKSVEIVRSTLKAYGEALSSGDQETASKWLLTIKTLVDIDAEQSPQDEGDTPEETMPPESESGVEPDVDTEFGPQNASPVSLDTAEPGQTVMAPVESIGLNVQLYSPRSLKADESQPYDPSGQPLEVWRNPATGSVELINGRKRLRAAAKQGVETVPVTLIAANTAHEARIQGLLSNVKSGTADPIDVAILLKHPAADGTGLGQYVFTNAPSVYYEAEGLAGLPDDAFDAVVQGEVDSDIGSAVGRSSLADGPKLALSYVAQNIRESGQDVRQRTVLSMASLLEAQPGLDVLSPEGQVQLYHAARLSADVMVEVARHPGDAAWERIARELYAEGAINNAVTDAATRLSSSGGEGYAEQQGRLFADLRAIASGEQVDAKGPSTADQGGGAERAPEGREEGRNATSPQGETEVGQPESATPDAPPAPGAVDLEEEAFLQRQRERERKRAAKQQADSQKPAPQTKRKSTPKPSTGSTADTTPAPQNGDAPQGTPLFSENATPNSEDFAQIDEITKRLNDLLKGNANAGVDPEVAILMAKLMYRYVKVGMRNFADVVSKLAESFGSNMRKLAVSIEEAWEDLTGEVRRTADYIDLDLLDRRDQGQNTGTTDQEAQPESGQQQDSGGTTDEPTLEQLLTEAGLSVETVGNELIISVPEGRINEFREHLDEAKFKPVAGGTGQWRGRIDAGWNLLSGLRDAGFLSQRRALRRARSASDPKLISRRRDFDQRVDTGEREDDLVERVGASTQELIRNGGAKVGMPEERLREQIADVGAIVAAHEAGQTAFVLASDPGTGKTFVLGGAIRELLQSGRVNSVTYVTMNQELIGQVRANLELFGLNRVEFVTYSGMRDIEEGSEPDTDVLVFDESHNVKNSTRQQARAAARWIERSKFVVLASATPFANPVDAHYLASTGIFERNGFEDFADFAVTFGATLVKVKDQKRVLWISTQTSREDASAANKWFVDQGLMVSRRLSLPEGMVDGRMAKVSVDDSHVSRHELFAQAADKHLSSLPGYGSAWVVNLTKRMLEWSKYDSAIAEAKSAMESGRFPIIFAETKSPRVIDIRYLASQEIAYQQARASKQAVSRNDFGLPPEGVVDMLETYALMSGEWTINIPGLLEVMSDAFGAENVGFYMGKPISDTQAKKDLQAWRDGTKRLLVATMAKGGTGLSLHDTVGNHPTTQINLSLPWTATGIVQVTQRSARYGLKSPAEIIWLFSDQIVFDQWLAKRVGRRMADMGAVVHGQALPRSGDIENFDVGDMPFSEMRRLAKEEAEQEARSADAQNNPPEDLEDELVPELPLASPRKAFFTTDESGNVTFSDAFLTWFGASQVVDASGAPRVMYHGTRGDFDVFERVDGGNAYGTAFYFTSDPEVASRYATGDIADRVTPEGASGPNVMPVYLRAENLFRTRNVVSQEDLENLEKAVMALQPGAIERGQLVDRFDGSYEAIGDNVLMALRELLFDANNANRALRMAGFDGIDSPQGIAVFDANQIKSAIGNSGDFDTANDLIVGQYAGEKANLSQFMADSLLVARQMHQDGQDSDTIRATTGWFIGRYDQKLRWEIPDKNASLTPLFSALQPGETATLEDILDHPELFKAYPALKTMAFAIEDVPSGLDDEAQAWFDRPSNRIVLSTRANADKLSAILHEIQHVIQRTEGFATGSNSVLVLTQASASRLASTMLEELNWFSKQIDAAKAEIKKLRDVSKALKQIPAEERSGVDMLASQLQSANTVFEAVMFELEDRGLSKADIEQSSPYRNALTRISQLSEALYRNFGLNDNAVLQLLSHGSIQESLAAMRSRTDILKKHIASRQALQATANTVTTLDALRVFLHQTGGGDRLYRTVAGEIEARDVQARAGLDENQLAETSPYSLDNISESDAIVLFDTANITAMSVDAGADALPQTGTPIRQVLKDLQDNVVTADQAANRIEAIIASGEEQRRLRREERKARPRLRGYNRVMEALHQAHRRGQLPTDAFELAVWFLDKNPNAADDLAISIRLPKGQAQSLSGTYTPLNRLVTLFRGNVETDTVLHEVMHHLERLMPRPIQAAIRSAWAKELAKAIAASTDQKRTDALMRIFEAHNESGLRQSEARRQVQAAFNNGTLTSRDYYLLNPSEYWAVKAVNLLANRKDAEQQGWVARAKQWLSEFIAKVKDIFGLASDAPIIKGLSAVLDGDMRTSPAGGLITGNSGARIGTTQVGARRNDLKSALEHDPMDVAPAAVIDGRLIVSTRFPISAKATPPSNGQPLVTRYAERDGLQSNTILSTIADAIRSTHLITDQQAQDYADSPEDTIEAGINEMKRNLRWLWDVYEPYRERAKRWYTGAHRIARSMVDQYGISLEQAAAVIAVLSPQRHWFHNVAGAMRVVEIYNNMERDNPTFTGAMFTGYAARARATARTDAKKAAKEGAEEGYSQRKINKLVDEVYQDAEAAIKLARKDMVGKTWKELSSLQQAIMLRSVDAKVNSAEYYLVTPEGEMPDFHLTGSGKRAKIQWGSNAQIESAILVLRDGSPKSIHWALGYEHKVRSFFNNIMDPTYKHAVTIDTHAVAAAYLRALGSGSREVKMVFASKANMSDVAIGWRGLNPIVAEAYFRLAEDLSRELGTTVYGSEVQSVTWEAARSLFSAAQKRSKLPQKVADIWDEWRQGLITKEQAHERIFTLASNGTIRPPDWSNHEPQVAYDKGRILSGHDVARASNVSGGRRTRGSDSSRSPRRDTDLPDGPVVSDITVKRRATSGEQASALRTIKERISNALNRIFERRYAKERKHLRVVWDRTTDMERLFALAGRDVDVVLERKQTIESANGFARIYKSATPEHADAILSPETYKKTRMFVTKSGNAGFALNAKGRIVSYFSDKESGQDVDLMMVALAIHVGAKTATVANADVDAFLEAGFVESGQARKGFVTMTLAPSTASAKPQSRAKASSRALAAIGRVANTLSDNFNRFIKGSVVTHVVYHGTPDARFANAPETAIFKTASERIFDAPSGDGAFYFTKDRSVAESYADAKRAFYYQNAEPGVIPVYLSLKNPLRVDGKGRAWREAQQHKSGQSVIAYAKSMGHDGVIISNVVDNYSNMEGLPAPTDVYVAFRPEQIKHATKNAGTYDQDSPSILNAVSSTPTSAAGNAPSRLNVRMSVLPTEKGLDPEVNPMAGWDASQGDMSPEEAARRIAIFKRQLAEGLITQKQFDLLQDFVEKSSGVLVTNGGASRKQLERGYVAVREALSKAKREKRIDGRMADMAIWLLDSNPAMANGLALEIDGTPTGYASAQYDHILRMIRIFEGTSKGIDAVHEIVHHMHTFMPAEMKQALEAQWRNAVTLAWQRSWQDPERREAIESIIAAHNGDEAADAKTEQAIVDGVLSVVEDYDLMSPYEFWTVHASDILQRRFDAQGSWVKKLINWVREFFIRASSIIGSPKSDILVALEDILQGNGERAYRYMTPRFRGRSVSNSPQTPSMGELGGKPRPSNTIPPVSEAGAALFTPEQTNGNLMPIKMPELVKLAKELNTLPEIVAKLRKLGRAGDFSPSKKRIRLNPDLFQQGREYELAAVLAHELGHLVDYLPDGDMGRGGILGRLGTLKNFRKHLFVDALGNDVALNVVTAELKDLSKLWRPWNPSTASAEERKYRNSSKELYADAISVLLVNPGLLEQRAPTFFKTFFAELDKKPEVFDAYFNLQRLLSGSGDDLQADRLMRMATATQEGDVKAIELQKMLQLRNESTMRSFGDKFLRGIIDTHYPFINRVKEVQQKGTKVDPDSNVVFALNELRSLYGKQAAWLKGNIVPIHDAVMGLSTGPMQVGKDLINDAWQLFGIRLALQRIALGDRSTGIPNPHGYNAADAADLLSYIRRSLSAEQNAILDRADKDFRDVVRSVFLSGHEAGLYTDFQKNKILSNPYYVTFQVVEHMESQIQHDFEKQEGTFKGINNAANATISKMLSLIEAAERNKVRQLAVTFLHTHFPGDITQAPMENGQPSRPNRDHPKRLELVKYYEDGKVRGVWVDPFIKASLYDETFKDPSGGLAIALTGEWLNRKWFRPVFVMVNVGFQANNFLKDLNRTYINLGARNKASLVKILAAYYRNLPEATVRAFGLSKNNSSERMKLAYERVTAMESAGILSYTHNEIQKDGEVGQTQIENIQRQFGILEPSHRGWAGKTMETLKSLGDLIETLPKAAAVDIMLRQKGGTWSVSELDAAERDFVRRKVGSPDFRQHGVITPLSNNLFLFSNAMIQATRADIEVHTDPSTRSGAFMRRFVTQVIPKMVMFALAKGIWDDLYNAWMRELYGDDWDESMASNLKERYSEMTEYDKTNYLCVPNPFTDHGYFRFPMDEFGRSTTGTLWKAMQAASNDPVDSKVLFEDLRDLFSYTAGQAPSFNPVLSTIFDLGGYMVGENIYDTHRQRYVLSERQSKFPRWQEDLKVGGYLFAQLGGNAVMQYVPAGKLIVDAVTGQRSFDQSLPLIILENTPIAASFSNRWYRDTQYGKTEEYVKAGRAAEKRRYQQSLDVSDAIYDQVREWGDDPPMDRATQMDAARAIAEQFDDVDAGRIRKRLSMAVARGGDDPLVDAVMSLQYTDGKVDTLLAGLTDFDEEERKAWIDEAVRNDVISQEVRKKFWEALRQRDEE